MAELHEYICGDDGVVVQNDKLQPQHIMATKAHHSGDGIAGDACHFSFKVCLLGDSGVGKSELLKTAGKARHTCTQQAKLNAGCKSCQCNSARGGLQAPHLEQPVKQRLVLSLEYVWQQVVFG